MSKIAFDIDDTTLIPSVVTESGDNIPNYEVIAVLRWFQNNGHEIILWSGSGVDWAKRWGEKFGLEPFTVRMKEKTTHIETECIDGKFIETEVPDIDIAFDDCDVNLAKVNIKVKRHKNSISREEWNKNKQ